MCEGVKIVKSTYLKESPQKKDFAELAETLLGLSHKCSLAQNMLSALEVVHLTMQKDPHGTSGIAHMLDMAVNSCEGHEVPRALVVVRYRLKALQTSIFTFLLVPWLYLSGRWELFRRLGCFVTPLSRKQANGRINRAVLQKETAGSIPT